MNCPAPLADPRREPQPDPMQSAEPLAEPEPAPVLTLDTSIRHMRKTLLHLATRLEIPPARADELIAPATLGGKPRVFLDWPQRRRSTSTSPTRLTSA